MMMMLNLHSLSWGWLAYYWNGELTEEVTLANHAGFFFFCTHLLKRRTTSSSFRLPCSALNISITRWSFHIRCFSKSASNSATYCSSVFILPLVACDTSAVYRAKWYHESLLSRSARETAHDKGVQKQHGDDWRHCQKLPMIRFVM